MRIILTALFCLFTGSVGAYADSMDEKAEEVASVERAFAKSMADRDLEAFVTFVDEEAVFVSGPEQVLRGRDAVVQVWKAFFEEEVAPFSWEPDEVLVLASGLLALSSGPVKAADGRVVARFNSTWRQNESGEWKVVFDKGQPVCPDAS